MLDVVVTQHLKVAKLNVVRNYCEQRACTLHVVKHVNVLYLLEGYCNTKDSIHEKSLIYF